MTRYPYAAKTLIKQVRAQFPETIVAADIEPDGYGVIRSIRFDAKASKWLEPIMQAAADDRIASVDDSTDELGVTFVSGIKADNGERFLLREVEVILNEDDEGPPNEEDHQPDEPDPEPAPEPAEEKPKKKAPAKKKTK